MNLHSNGRKTRANWSGFTGLTAFSAAIVTSIGLMAGAARSVAAPAAAGAAVPAQPSGTILTVYSSADPAGFNPRQWVYQTGQGGMGDPNSVPGFGVVKQVRTLNLKAGDNRVDFTNVAALIDPTSVSFSDLTDPATSVLEQQFKFDLVNQNSILQKYIGHKLSVWVPVGNRGLANIHGRLFHAGGSLVLKTKNGIDILAPNTVQQIRLAALPTGLITKPTLEWQLFSPKAGKQKILTSYQTKGLTWIADYNLVLNPDNTKAGVAAWVTLVNLSGKSYRNAHLKLIAGTVNRIQPPQPVFAMLRTASIGGVAAPQGFQQKRFFEYHMYTLPRRTTIPDNSMIQIALFPTRQAVTVKRELEFSGQTNTYWWNYANSPDLNNSPSIHFSGSADVYIRLQNSKANGMGMPLPRGKVRLYQQDAADGTLEFVGEDLLKDTPKDGRLKIHAGQAFDITGTRTQTNFHSDNAMRILDETFKIVLHNHQSKPVTVQVPQYLYRWSNWKITHTTEKFKKINSREIRFHLAVPANGKTTLTYTVRYSW